ncbi:zinc finger CCHC domain-containing protein 7, partial [Clarias magur]
LEMFSGYQEREEYEDELYAEEDLDNDSGPDSDLEFQLYSQLHYCADEHEKRAENHEENRPSSCHESQPGPKVQPLSAPLDDIIMIDSGPDIITVSDTTEEEEEESVCTRKGQRSKEKGLAPALQPHRYEEEQEVVVLNSDSDSDDSSDSESVPPFVADLDSDSDSDRLESWMILGQEKEDGDHDIQLNVFTVHNQGQP